MYKIPGLETYFGGKGGEGVYQSIINHIPPHKTFISGFLGNCAILRYKRPAKWNFGIEIDAEIYTKWDNHFPKYSDSPYFMFLNCSFLTWVNNRRLDKTMFNNDTFIYLDPPYPIEVRKSLHRYKYEMTNLDHYDLLTLIKKLPAMVAISTYDNSMYEAELKGWNKIHFNATTRRGLAKETLYMNYELGGELHDYRYLGKDFHDRDRIKRKINRHITKLKGLPLHEQKAILQALESNFKDIPAATLLPALGSE